MVLWLLDHLSTIQLIGLVVGGTTALAVGTCLVVQRLFPHLHASDFDQATSAMRGGFTLLFGLILGLSISNVSAKLSSAQANVTTESTALAQLTLASRAIAPGERATVNGAIGWYDHAVAEDEWLTMQQGKESPLASAALANLYGVYQGYTPGPGPETAAYNASLSRLDQVTTARRDRLQKDAAGLPAMLRVLLAVGVVMFNCVWYPATITGRTTQLVVVACVAAFSSFAYLLTILLDYPFAGDLGVSSHPYMVGVLAPFWHHM
jgi:hypothetical protein